jgi:hypothetical protein
MSWLTTLSRGGIYLGRIHNIFFALARSPQCLLHCSVTWLVWVEHHLVEGEACNPLVDDAWIPSYIGLLAMIFLITSSSNFSNSIGSPDNLDFNRQTG